MKVIINSDIIYHSQLVIDNMSKPLQTLFRACSERGHAIIIPLTTLYEFNRKQSELVPEEISKLESMILTQDLKQNQNHFSKILTHV